MLSSDLAISLRHALRGHYNQTLGPIWPRHSSHDAYLVHSNQVLSMKANRISILPSPIVRMVNV